MWWDDILTRLPPPYDWKRLDWTVRTDDGYRLVIEDGVIRGLTRA